METSVYLASMPEEFFIYLALGVCGLSILFLALHVQRRFVRTNGALSTLTALNKEWEEAEASFRSIAEEAREKISGLETAPARSPSAGPADIGFDLRNQVVSMAKRGATPAEIALMAGVTEAEVDVIVGMSRIASKKT